MDINTLSESFDIKILSTRDPLTQFQEILYKQILAVEKNPLVCAVCQDEIDSLSELCRPKCSCMLWYHKECLSQSYKDTKQSGRCLQCRAKSPLYNWETALKKFWLSSADWKQLYNTIYYRICKANLYDERIQMHKLFFGDITVYREKYPNYILLPVHDFQNYLKFDEEQFYTTLNLETLVPSVPSGELGPGKKRTLLTAPLFTNGESTVLPQNIFKNKLQEFSYGLLADFKWDNVFLAGGSLYRLINPKLVNYIPDTSDLDLFIYGSENQIRKKALERILTHFNSKYKEDVFFIVHEKKGLIDMYVRGIARHIQIICNEAKTIIDIIERFDFSHIQICYFNDNLYATPDALKSIKTQISYEMPPGSTIIKSRILKSLGFHLSLVLSNNPKPKDYHKAAEQCFIDPYISDEEQAEVEDPEYTPNYVDMDQPVVPDNNNNNTNNNNNNNKPELTNEQNETKDISLIIKELSKEIPEQFIDVSDKEITESLVDSLKAAKTMPKLEKTYHPTFEESDEDIIQSLRALHKDKEVLITKDIILVQNKVKFVKRENVVFYYS